MTAVETEVRHPLRGLKRDALTNLHEVAQLLSAAHTVDDVLDVLVGQGIGATDAAGGAVFLVDASGTHIEVQRARGYRPGVVELHRRLPLDLRTPITDCVREGRAIYVGSGPGPYAGENADVYAIESEARAAVPMVASGQIIGALKFSFDEQRVFDDHDRVFFDALARQGAQALERARLFEAERAARTAAEDADRKKDEFLAMLGHELRNPLAPIRTALELMRLRGVPAAREQQVIERQVEHLSRLVDDLLDVSRITRGKVRLDKKPLEIATALAKAVELASPLFEQRAHVLTLDVPRHGLMVCGDLTRLAQVLSNLLTNAAKYTDAGGHVQVTGRRDGGEIVVEVSDNGIGIAPELLATIFEPFVQGDRQIDRQQGGLGLGLALARNLLELHDGTIRVESPGVGRGSKFTVRLPVHEGVPVEPQARRATALGATPSRRILVVDDNVDAADLIAEVLRGVGNEVALAHDGPSALAAAAEFHPDAALVDIGLPVMDGYEVATRLRESNPSGLRLVAVTGYGQESDRARSIEAGFDEHLVKPVGLEALLASLSISPPPRRAR